MRSAAIAHSSRQRSRAAIEIGRDHHKEGGEPERARWHGSGKHGLAARNREKEYGRRVWHEHREQRVEQCLLWSVPVNHDQCLPAIRTRPGPGKAVPQSPRGRSVIGGTAASPCHYRGLCQSQFRETQTMPFVLLAGAYQRPWIAIDRASRLLGRGNRRSVIFRLDPTGAALRQLRFQLSGVQHLAGCLHVRAR